MEPQQGECRTLNNDIAVAIRQAAIACYDEFGLGVKVATIARRAGVVPLTVRRYYGGKNGLLNHTLEVIMERVGKMAASKPDDFWEVIVALADPRCRPLIIAAHDKYEINGVLASDFVAHLLWEHSRRVPTEVDMKIGHARRYAARVVDLLYAGWSPSIRVRSCAPSLQ